MCACMCELGKKRKKKEGIVAGQKQPLGAVWCKTRLFNSGGQFDQLCNLIGGAILARALCQRIVELSSPTAMGVQGAQGPHTRARDINER